MRRKNTWWQHLTLFSHPTACFRSGFFTGVCFWFFTGCNPFLPRHHQLIRGKKKCLRAASGVGIAVGWSTNSSFASISMRNNCAAGALWDIKRRAREMGGIGGSLVSGKTFPQVAGSRLNSNPTIWKTEQAPTRQDKKFTVAEKGGQFPPVQCPP